MTAGVSGSSSSSMARVTNSFTVTAGTGSDFDGISYLAIGTGSTGQSGALDIQGLSWAPGVFEPVAVREDQPALTIERSGGDVVITWSGGTLQSASSVDGPYTDVAGASSPLTEAASDAAKFYRAV